MGYMLENQILVAIRTGQGEGHRGWGEGGTGLSVRQNVQCACGGPAGLTQPVLPLLCPAKGS